MTPARLAYMMSSTGKSAQQVLDEVWTLAQLEAFSADEFLRQLGEEAATLESPVDHLNDALGELDAFASKTMRIRLHNVLASDTAIPTQFRTYLASQIVDYDGDLPRLRERVTAAMGRTAPSVAAELADAVTAAAGDVLAMRAHLRQGVLALMPPPPEPVAEPVPQSREELIELD